MACFRTAYVILLIVTAIESKCLQTSFPSANVRVCSKKCIYQTVQNCVDADDFLGDIGEVTLTAKVPVFRRGIFNNMDHLRNVIATNAGIKRIQPDAFHNSPNIETIDFIFNYIEEIPWGVFNNMSFEKIDLSWNSLNYIEEEAFSYLPNLQTLLLTHNQLTTFDKKWLTGSPNLKTLNLSYNKIAKLWFWAFDTFPNLTFLDLSFNQLVSIGDDSFKNVKFLKLLDLTSNNLTALTSNIFANKLVVKELRIALNRLSFLSEELLNKGTVQSIIINPNPWQCPCLNRIYDWAHKNNATILTPDVDYRLVINSDLPVCAFKEQNRNDCVLDYDEEFLSTQTEYFNAVKYTNVIREKPTSEPPNFGVLIVDHSRDNLSPI